MPHRIERINHLIRQEISDMLQRQVKDPRLGSFIAITDVVTSPDLKSARVFISHLGSTVERKETMGALRSATGYLRSELAKRLRIRRVPEITFLWDDSIEHGAHMEELFDRVIAPKQDTEKD